jgi:hypothetical protein
MKPLELGVNMIVKCKSIFNENTQQYSDSDLSSCFSKGYHYNVLSIEFCRGQIYFRIISDRSGLYNFPILVRTNEFEIITNVTPHNWVLDKDRLSLNPEKWSNSSLWMDGFWMDYDAALPNALQSYRDEIKTIISADKDYIQVMIDERSNNDVFKIWRESMVPLLNEVTSDHYYL